MQTIEVLKKMSDRVELVKQRVDFADRWFHYSTTPILHFGGGEVAEWSIAAVLKTASA